MLNKALDVARFVDAFQKRGFPTGTTPHQVIFRQGRSMLRYFAPENATRAPVFISMPLINTWTVFDLLPDRSVVRAMLDAGAPVYLLDWGRPEAEHAEVTFGDHVDGVLHRMIDRARRHARAHHDAASLDMLGYCVGGTVLAVYLARYPDAARRVAFLCTPIDFHQSGRLSTWANPEHFPVDEIIDQNGNFPGDLMKTSMAWLRPTGQVGKWKSLWDRFEQPGFQDTWRAVEAWNDDNVPFPGATYREYIKRCYFDNALMSGGWVLDGRPVDLSRAKQPALVLAADGDHIVEPAAAFALEKVWGGPVETALVRGGHVGVCLGGSLPAKLRVWIDAGVLA